MAPERNRHNLTKQRTWRALDDAVRARNMACTVLGDGATVIVDEITAYEPDVTVQCGAEIDLDAVTADHPLILVEVVSPATGDVDTGQKLEDYFRLPSVRHYLILRAEAKTVIHHARRADGAILTAILKEGVLTLDPPGLTVEVAALFP
jgi:Uma2 family endonuclease